MNEPEDFSDRLTKSERKRKMLALQHIGEVLVTLPPAELSKIPLSETLYDAVVHAQSITDGEGKRRQLQYIGKLMRHVEIEPIEEAISKVQSKDLVNKATFHHIEKWRDKLIAEGDKCLEEFLNKFPAADSQQLRQLVRKAQKDQKDEKNSGAFTALFRYLREIIEA